MILDSNTETLGEPDPTVGGRSLAEQAALYRALFETIPDGILVVDDAGRYFDVDEAYCGLLKATREQLLGADTGVGIEPEALPYIFDAFEQGRARSPRRIGGLGLGLAISKAIAEMHGGSLTACSDLGLPDGSGVDLMRELSRRYGLKGIALSGYGMDEDVRQSLEAGFQKHLTKPVNLQRLEAAIRQVVGEGR